MKTTPRGKIRNTLLAILPLIALIVPVLLSYSLYPDSFDKTWKGRTYQLFFLWLVSLELLLRWDEIKIELMKKWRLWRTLALGLSAVLLTIHVSVVASSQSVNQAISEWAIINGVGRFWAEQLPLTVEYFVLGLLFLAMIVLIYGVRGPTHFPISIAFVFAIGLIYLTDIAYPEGRFTPFQIIVPATATLAMSILGTLGYQTAYLGTYSSMPTYMAWDSAGNRSMPFSIAWPCSGAESFILYTVTILLFLRKSELPRASKIGYFAFGAIVTYFINAIRIATIYMISINGGDWGHFHDSFGQLYSITWIIVYPILIIGSKNLIDILKREHGTIHDELPVARSQRVSLA